MCLSLFTCAPVSSALCIQESVSLRLWASSMITTCKKKTATCSMNIKNMTTFLSFQAPLVTAAHLSLQLNPCCLSCSFMKHHLIGQHHQLGTRVENLCQLKSTWNTCNRQNNTKVMNTASAGLPVQQGQRGAWRNKGTNAFPCPTSAAALCHGLFPELHPSSAAVLRLYCRDTQTSLHLAYV